MDEAALQSTILSAIDCDQTVDLMAVSAEIRNRASKWQEEHAGAEVPEWVYWENTALFADLVRRPRNSDDTAAISEPLRGLGLDKYRAQPSAVDYWCQRAAATPNPTARARYADLGWMGRATAKDRRAFPLALTAIDAYLQQATLALTVDRTSSLVDALDRAAQIACRIKNHEKARAVAETSLSALAALPDDERARWSLEIFESLDLLAENFDALLTVEEFEVLERTLLAAATHFEATSAGNPFLPAEALESAARAAKRLGARDRMLEHRAAVADLLRRAAKVRERAGGASGGAGVASGFVEGALHRLQHVLSLGPEPDLEARLRAALAEVRRDLRRLIKLTEEQLKQHPQRFEFEFPLAQREAFVAHVLSRPEAETFRLLVLDPSLHLPIDSFRASAAESAKVTWIHKIFPTTVVRQGRKTFRPPAEHDPERDVEDLLRVWLTLHLHDLDFLFSRLSAAGRLTVDLYLAHFDDWVLLDEADRPFLATGMERYLSGDYVSAIHVLVPRIEHMLKSAFEQVGLPPIAVPSETEVKEQTFGDFLRRDGVRRALGDGLWTQLYYVLVDEQGMNLRNDVAHGWVSADACNRGVASLAAFLPLLLTFLVPSASEPAKPPGSSADREEDKTPPENPGSPAGR